MIDSMERFIAAGALAITLAACSPAPAPVNIEDSAQVRAVVRDYLMNDPDVLREALDALAARQRAERVVAAQSDERDIALGPADAPITIVEFFDYRCPFCHAATEWVFATQSRRQDVRIVFKEFPVLGPASVEASRAAMGVIPQGQRRYIAFHRALMGNTGELSSARIDEIARASGVDVARMRRDMANPAIEEHLARNHGLARDFEIDGTPGFLINGEYVSGFNEEALNETLARVTREVGARRGS